MKTKIPFLTMALFSLVLLVSNHTAACDFKFKVATEEKKTFQVGDEVVIEVQLSLTHRSCPEGLEATKFDFTGLKVLGATKWKELPDGKYERKFKLQVTEDPKNKHLLSAVRTCDKDGGSGSVKIDVN
jgi:hypothetical protein